ncbi:hypothetical protein H4Q32_007531 [Labeo rohita]|uniref:Xenotropic and polytropic retrovirus receptor 1-like protein n=1 Tax=Labeo rohita TaxID=84645 RepID=A0ABQ8MGJ1_LABRO|nr:hypothetical protein H4Q32_007531 [Labeo rohita]
MKTPSNGTMPSLRRSSFRQKLAEAQRRFATLQNELQTSLDAQRESNAPGLRSRRKTVFPLSNKERNKHRNIKDLQLAFSEFYLSLILLQNYQNLNFTGFRKILKKHDKILDTQRGADWRVAHVEVAPFYTCKKITQLISETEALVTTELEGGDRQKAMKRLRVPPLGAAQPAPAWTTFRVGLYCGVFIVLAVSFVLTGVFIIQNKNIWPLVRIYRGGFLLVQFLFLLGINTYGWRQAGVNHIAGFLGVLWCLSILSCLFADHIWIPMQANPLILYGFMVLFLINPFKTAYYKSRFWLIKLLFRVFTAPFHRVEFADFWLADQLNSLVIVLSDLEYLVCYYSMELQWGDHSGLLPSTYGDERCNSYSYGVRAIIHCLPAWLRFVQCLRRYRDTRRAFPHLVNAGKYSTTFFVYKCMDGKRSPSSGHSGNIKFASSVSDQKHADAEVFFYMLILSSVASSLYTLIWDLKMDWGLFDRNAGENTFLREEIVYPHKNEHLNNCGEFRAVRDISVAPLNADDQTLLEQMMDQEDGVRNRQGKKSWKRSYSLSLRRPLLSSQ